MISIVRTIILKQFQFYICKEAVYKCGIFINCLERIHFTPSIQFCCYSMFR